jgi:RNA polymerase sigma factor (TIGR02999 family)
VQHEVTQIFEAIDRGDPRASEALLPLVYEELRRLADSRLAREHSTQTLQATGLVHEAYLRLIGPNPNEHAGWDSRGHFFAAAAEAMRRILIDRARARNAQKRGGGSARRISLRASVATLDESPSDLLELDEALEQLSGVDPMKGELVKLRFYAGLTMPQAADVLGISLSTAERQWAFARAWLFSRLGDDQDNLKDFPNR